MARWFSTGQRRSPVTNEPLTNDALTPNRLLATLVLNHRAKVGRSVTRSLVELGVAPSSWREWVGDGVTRGAPTHTRNRRRDREWSTDAATRRPCT